MPSDSSTTITPKWPMPRVTASTSASELTQALPPASNRQSVSTARPHAAAKSSWLTPTSARAAAMTRPLIRIMRLIVARTGFQGTAQPRRVPARRSALRNRPPQPWACRCQHRLDPDPQRRVDDRRELWRVIRRQRVEPPGPLGVGIGLRVGAADEPEHGRHLPAPAVHAEVLARSRRFAFLHGVARAALE